MSNIKFRNALINDIPAVIHLWRQSFPGKDDKYWKIHEERLLAGLKTRKSIVRLAFKRDNEIIGSVQHLFSHVRIGTSIITNDHLGEVSVLPQLQGQGMGTCIMQDSMNFIESNNEISIASLGGLVKFYSRFGFTRFPTSYLSIPIKDERGGAQKIPFSDVVEIKDKESLSGIRKFDPIKDKKEYFNLSKPGTGQRYYDRQDYEFEHVKRKSSDELTRLVYERQGNILAYLFIYNESIVYDFGMSSLPDAKEALSILLCTTLQNLNKKGISELRLTEGNPAIMQNVLSEMKIAYSLISGMGGVASRMMFIPHLALLFENIREELNQRFFSLPFDWNGKIRIHVDDRNLSCVLIVKNNSIESIQDELNTQCDVEFRVSQSHLLMRLFGINSGTSLDAMISPLNPITMNLYNILFVNYLSGV